MDAVKQKYRAELLTNLMTTLLLVGKVSFKKDGDTFTVVLEPYDSRGAHSEYSSSRLEHALEKTLRKHTTCYDGDSTR